MVQERLNNAEPTVVLAAVQVDIVEAHLSTGVVVATIPSVVILGSIRSRSPQPPLICSGAVKSRSTNRPAVPSLSPRTLKKQHLLELKRKNNAPLISSSLLLTTCVDMSRPWLLLGRLIALYFTLVISFFVVLPLVNSPRQFDQLFHASLATPTFVTTQLSSMNNPQQCQNKKRNQFELNTTDATNSKHPLATTSTTCKNIQPVSTTEQALQITFEQGILHNGVSFYRCGRDFLQEQAELQLQQCNRCGVGRGNPPTLVSNAGCAASTTSSVEMESRDVVILDGGRFLNPKKRTQDERGNVNFAADAVGGERSFLELCRRAEQSRVVTTVVLLDHGDILAPGELQNVMEQLVQSQKVTALPVAALVTPGPSVEAVVDWIMYGDVTTLTSHISRHWIAVSAETVLQTLNGEDEAEVDVPDHASATLHSSPLHTIENWSVLAVYGNADKQGLLAAELLQKEASAQVAKLEGGKYCYLDSPQQFSDTIFDYIEEKLLAAGEKATPMQEFRRSIPISLAA